MSITAFNRMRRVAAEQAQQAEVVQAIAPTPEATPQPDAPTEAAPPKPVAQKKS